MAFCINCGSQVPDGARFCAACGTPVATIPATAPAPEPEPVTAPVPETTPVPESTPEPAPAPAPEPVPEPVSEPAPVQATQQFIQVQPTDVDPDLDMEGPPIVGNYAIPGMENVPRQQYTPPVAKAPSPQPEYQQASVPQQRVPVGNQPKASKPAKAPKQPSEGAGGFGKIMMIIIGALIALAIILSIVGIILKAAGIGGGSSGKADGTGTALTELLDNAAASYYNGVGVSSSVGSDAADKDEDTDAEETDEEDTSDVAGSNEQLFQGCIYATLPAGFVQGGSDGTSEEEFYREDDKDCTIKLHISSSGSAKEAAEEDVNWWIEKKGEDSGYSIVDDVKAGNYTWTVEHYPFNGEVSSAKFYADTDDKYHLEVVCFMMNETNPDVISFLESIHMEDGDPGKLRSEWLDSRNK